MRVLCPSCQQLVTVADSAAGQSTPCPQCGRPFTPPALTGAAVDAAPAPAPPVTTTAAPVAPRVPDTMTGGAAPTQSYAPPATGLRRTGTWTLHPDVIRWIAPVSLVIAFILAFFTWLAVAPNGNVIYAQSGWQAASGGFSIDAPADEIFARAHALHAERGWNGWLVLYLIVLIVTAILAVADLVIAIMNLTVPDAVRPIWPHRSAILLALTALLLIALIIPLATGFGLENSVATAAEKAVPPPATGPNGEPPTARAVQIRDLNRDLEVARYSVRRSGWLWLSLFVDIAALVGAGMSLWLSRRGDRPLPRAEFYC